MRVFEKITNLQNHDKYKMLISEYIDGELKNSELDTLFEHLKTCEDCKNYLSDAQKIRTCMRQSTSENFDLSFNLDLNFSDKIIFARENKKIFYKRHFLGFAAAAICLFVLISTSTKMIPNYNLATNYSNSNIWPSVGDLDNEAMDIYYSEYI